MSEKNLFTFAKREEVDLSKVEALSENSASFWKKARHKFFSHKISVFWFTTFLVLVALSIIVPLTSKYGINTQNLSDTNLGPSAQYWFGTDANGEDLFVRTWHGLGVSMLIGLFVTVLSFFVGLPIGLIQGYFGGKVDEVLLAIEQIIQSVPDIILFIVILLAFGRGPITFGVALATYMWLDTAFQARANSIQQKNLEYVLVAKTLGTSDIKIIFKHILPNIIARQIIIVSSLIPAAIMYEAFLSFIGIGIDQTSNVTIGGLLSKASELIITYPNQILLPAAVLIVFVVSINFIAMGLQYALDEKL